MTNESLPQYSVQELNEAIGNLLDRGFAPRFLLQATVAKAQLKKGHLWLTFTDGNSSINGVIWSSSLSKIKFHPSEDDGVLVVAKLNFWVARANLSIQVIDIRPSISTVLKKFEIAKSILLKEGLINPDRRQTLPIYPKGIAILTSVPSSALADIQKTAKDRWPMTKLFVISIPVQGHNTTQVQSALKVLSNSYKKLEIDALVLARGGGSREDLLLFDDIDLCREIAWFPIPVITGIGHEDDLTIADLVADHRSATPTAAIVDLLPSRESARQKLDQIKMQIKDTLLLSLNNFRLHLQERVVILKTLSPKILIERRKKDLASKSYILDLFSPYKLLARGFVIAKDRSGKIISSLNQLSLEDKLSINFFDGQADVIVKTIKPKEKLK